MRPDLSLILMYRCSLCDLQDEILSQVRIFYELNSDSSALLLYFMCISHHLGGSVDIELEVFVNRSTAPDLNSGKEQIEDILVLHLERGKDYFIPVTGNYLPSCYGTSIHSLCHMREPIQDMPQETLHKLVSAPMCRAGSVSLKFLFSVQGCLHKTQHSCFLFFIALQIWGKTGSILT